MKLFRIVCMSLILVAGLSGIKAQADSVMKFSLTDAQNYAIENFYMSKNAKLDMQAAKLKVWETTAIGLPQASISGSYQYIPGDIPTFDIESSMGDIFDPIYGALIDNDLLDPNDLPEGGEPAYIALRNTYNYGATISQLIFSGEYIVGLQASKAYKSLSEEANDKTEIELKKGVADIYFGLLILEQNKEILTKTLNNMSDNLSQIQKLFEVGLVEDTEVDQINLIVKQTENSMTSIEGQIEYMSNLFKYQIGLDPIHEVILTESLDDLVISTIVNDSSYHFELEDNIDFRMLSTQEKLMLLSMRREQSKYLPSIMGFYQYTDKLDAPDFDLSIKHVMGLSVEVPIVTSGSRIAKVSQARIEYEKAQSTKEQEINRLYMEAQQASFDYKIALEKYDNEKMNIVISEKLYDKTIAKHREGFVSSLELSLINNQYLQAQLSYSLAVQELLSAKVKLDKAYNKL